MTSLPQTQQRTLAAHDGRRRTATVTPAVSEACAAARGRARQALPAVDSSKEFGCVDWFLYPDVATAEVEAKRAWA